MEAMWAPQYYFPLKEIDNYYTWMKISVYESLFEQTLLKEIQIIELIDF